MLVFEPVNLACGKRESGRGARAAPRHARARGRSDGPMRAENEGKTAAAPLVVRSGRPERPRSQDQGCAQVCVQPAASSACSTACFEASTAGHWLALARAGSLFAGRATGCARFLPQVGASDRLASLASTVFMADSVLEAVRCVACGPGARGELLLDSEAPLPCVAPSRRLSRRSCSAWWQHGASGEWKWHACTRTKQPVLCGY